MVASVSDSEWISEKLFVDVDFLKKSDISCTMLHKLMCNLKTDIEWRKTDKFFGELRKKCFQILQIEKNFMVVYNRALNYLNKWYNFVASPVQN